MPVEHIEVLVEEPSMEIALRALIPRLKPGLSFNIIQFQGKQDLLKSLERQLRGYKAWLPNSYRILIVVDRDNQDCVALKTQIDQYAMAAGLTTKSANPQQFQVISRIVVEELEAWYFGDWEAVRQAYPGAPPTIPRRAPFRQSDAIAGGTWEAFERVMKQAGYFSGGLPKLEVAREISVYLSPDRSTSHSFRIFCSALAGLDIAAPAA